MCAPLKIRLARTNGDAKMDKKIHVKGRSDIEDEMRRLFSGFAQMRHRALLHAINLWHPATDVYETEKELCIVCELAGVSKDASIKHITSV